MNGRRSAAECLGLVEPSAKGVDLARKARQRDLWLCGRI
jgi:hypothetical protein